jgi:hypothetical protein
MKNITLNRSIFSLSNLVEMLDGLSEVRDTLFVKKIIKVKESIEQVRNEISLDSTIEKYIEEIEAIKPEIEKYEKAKNEVLIKYAAKDENGFPLTEQVTSNSGITEVYVMKKGQRIVDLPEEKLNEIFKTEEDKINYAKIDENGNPIKDENGKYILDEAYHVETVLRFAELAKVELEYEDTLKKANDINRKIYTEPIQVTFIGLTKKDESPNFNLKEYMLFKEILKALGE